MVSAVLNASCSEFGTSILSSLTQKRNSDKIILSKAIFNKVAGKRVAYEMSRLSLIRNFVEKRR